jgi:hypothetical protein
LEGERKVKLKELEVCVLTILSPWVGMQLATLHILSHYEKVDVRLHYTLILDTLVLACWSSGKHAWLTILKGSVSRFDPGQDTYKNLWISCSYKEGLSDETNNRGPLYPSVYARASKRSHTGGQ